MIRPPALAALLTLCGCASLSPRFEQDVATTFAQDEMRRLQTADVELYYPARYAEQAKRVAARATECVRALRGLQRTPREHGRVLLFLTSSNYNNAYVGGQSLGEPLHSLTPLSATDELFHWYGLQGSDTGDIACHEMFHFVHFEQVENFWRVVNDIVGPVVPSQVFLERWFTEGVAQYYEGRLGRAVGRPHSPLYRGAFDAYVVARDFQLGGGDLSLSQRELLPFSGAYLTGLYFVEWLAQTYGEEKLWDLMDVQGRSFFSPLGVTLRFKAVYGLSAGALLDAWNSALKATVAVRARPPAQRVLLPDVGQSARLATHPASGAIAVVSSGVEQVSTLRVLGADGRVRFEKKLAQFFPGRQWVLNSPNGMSGLSFSADGSSLFLVNDDLIDRGDTRSQIWKLDAATGEVKAVYQDVGRSMGGQVSGDGRTYTHILYEPEGGSQLVERDLERGTQTVILTSPPGEPIAAPAWSPDHSRLVVSQQTKNGWDLLLVGPDGSRRALTHDGAFNYAAHWVDERHVVFARAHGPYLQAHRLDVEGGALERLTDAAYGVLDPWPVPGGVAVLNRDGPHLSVDVAPDTALEEVAQPAGDADEAPAPRHEPPPLVVEADEPYSGWDHVFLPQLRLPGVLFSLGANPTTGATQLVTTLSASLDGRDRLGWHAWAINASLSLPTLENSVSVGYRNLQLAPWSLTLSGQRDGFSDETYWTGAISVDRTIFTTPVSFGVQAEVDQLLGAGTSHYVGPFASIAYSAGESTPYAGTQRLFAVSLDAAAYGPGSDRAMVDVRLGLAVAAPLPLSKRHSLLISLAGRTLPGAPDGALRIGGVSSGTALYVSRDRLLAKGPGVFLPGTLVEALRGYDDFGLRATAVGLGVARYRYAFIIDRGFLSLFYLFPSIFFRQVDLDAWASAAVTNNSAATWARAVGATVTVRALFGGAAPVSLYYQFAYRFDFALPPLHTVGFALE